MKAVQEFNMNGNNGQVSFGALAMLRDATFDREPAVADSAEAIKNDNDNDQPQGMDIQSNVAMGMAADTGFSIFDLGLSAVAPGFDMGAAATVAGVAVDAREEQSYQMALNAQQPQKARMADMQIANDTAMTMGQLRATKGNKYEMLTPYIPMPSRSHEMIISPAPEPVLQQQYAAPRMGMGR